MPSNVTLEVAKECIAERPRSRRGFTSVKTLESIEESRAARLAEDHDQYRALSRRTRTFLRRNKERYVRGLAEDAERHLNANDLRPAYQALKKLRSKSTCQLSALSEQQMVAFYRTPMGRWPVELSTLNSGQLQTAGLQTLDADPPIDETAPSIGNVKRLWQS